MTFVSPLLLTLWLSNSTIVYSAMGAFDAHFASHLNFFSIKLALFITRPQHTPLPNDLVEFKGIVTWYSFLQSSLRLRSDCGCAYDSFGGEKMMIHFRTHSRRIQMTF